MTQQIVKKPYCKFSQKDRILVEYYMNYSFEETWNFFMAKFIYKKISKQSPIANILCTMCIIRHYIKVETS